MIWAFLNSGPCTEDDYNELFVAMEQWDHPRFKIILEFEIQWMFNAIKNLCPDFYNFQIYEGISLFFNRKTGNASNIKDRKKRKKNVKAALKMIKSMNIKSKKISRAWSWMYYWYFNQKKNDNKLSNNCDTPGLSQEIRENELVQARDEACAEVEPLSLPEEDLDPRWPESLPDFTTWIQQELSRISRQRGGQLSAIRQAGGRAHPTGQFPLLHGGRVFPIDTHGQEIEKTIRAMIVNGRPVMVWGYRFCDFEPDVPYSPFAHHFCQLGSLAHKQILQCVLMHEKDSFIGGEDDGLVDFPADLQLTENILSRRNRDDSPLSHLVIG